MVDFVWDLETDGAGVTHGTDIICMIPFIALIMQVDSMIHGLEALAHHTTEVGVGEIPTTMDIIAVSTTAIIAGCITTIEI